MATGQHSFDMYGHQPGCGLCAEEQAEIAQRTRDERRKFQTLSEDSASKITVTVQIETSSGIRPTKFVERFIVPAGDQLDPTRIAITAQRLGLLALRDRNDMR